MWLNYAVKDVEETAVFFNNIGFDEIAMHKGNPKMRGFTIPGSDVAIMMFAEEQMKNFMQCAITDTTLGTEVLVNIGFESVEEVDAFYQKVQSASGTFFTGEAPIWVDGWMYLFGFSDPSGHKWSPMYMDISKFPQNK